MRATFQGSYIVSPETVNALDKLERGLESAWRAHTFFEIFDESYGSVRECLGIVREQARAELAPSWWRIFRA
jgi:hypothetical protein